MVSYEAKHLVQNHVVPTLEAQAVIPIVPQQEASSTLTWLKRGLVAAAIAGATYGGVETAMHYDEVRSDIIQHDKWAGVAIPITEGVAWGSTPIMLGAAARKLGVRRVSFKSIPEKMRALDHSKTFQISMGANMAGVAGTSAVLIAGAESLPASARPLAYGVAAASLGLSSIPIKVAYTVDKHKQRNRAQ